ncbi:MAG: M3 family oligoendopeptidase [Acholeplasmatales bacterium]|nr:MAG: M3 family oligoendopeptidase [Acholeplasmatales bacterium]
MIFPDLPYQRPDIDAIKSRFESALAQFEHAPSAEAQLEAMTTIHAIRFEFDTLSTLASIRHSLDTKDPFYDGEQAFFDEQGPHFQALNQAYYRALVASPYRAALSQETGELLFQMAEQTLKTFKPEIIPLLQQENSLATRYDKLVAAAEIPFQGETYNLSEMGPFRQSPDRAIRQAATRAMFAFFAEHEATLDGLFDELVKTRVAIADALGYPSFIELGYDRMGRLDYDAADVANYREQVRAVIVPLVSELVERQGRRIGVSDMKFYDLALDFLDGNPTPRGKEAELVQAAQAMYDAMSPETGAFFTMMRERELMDLTARKGKSGGGYCTALPDYKVPFIFANFNGTAADVDVLTHEAGHAFQVYMSMHHAVPEYHWPTMEACEIHSMSMEFFAWPWMDKFFAEDTEKYKFSHLQGALKFLPYGVLVDHFQHDVYADPSLSPKARRARWRELEQLYMPYKRYEAEDTFLEAGGFWFVQSHIFHAPFYYIDYTLAQVIAFQYWVWMQEDPQAAWDSYLTLCKAGGSRAFTGLLELASLDNPFKDGRLKRIVPAVSRYLDQVDDQKF